MIDIGLAPKRRKGRSARNEKEGKALSKLKTHEVHVPFVLKPTEAQPQPGEKRIQQPIADFIKEQGRIILSFSGGKDSLACWCVLRELGVEVKPFYLYMIPGLSWVEEYLEYLERWSGEHITRCLHPQFYNWIRTYGFQPPERAGAITLLKLPKFDYPDIEGGVRRTLALRHGEQWRGAWSCVGTRTQDSPMRRRSFEKYGWKREKLRKLYPLWNFKKDDLIPLLRRHKARLSPCYEMFGRSFDGVDFRFLDGIKKDFPADYQKILEWVPLAEAEFWRVHYAVKHGVATVT